jgi:type I restriction enzyme S subunit
LKKLKINLPSLAEQKKIARFLSLVDELATTQARRVELLTRYKTGVAAKVFSRAVRFRDSAGADFPDWEVRKLGELVDINMGQSPSSSAYNSHNDGLPLIQGNADITNRITTPRLFTSQITKTCDNGDIILTVRAPSGYVALANIKACIGRGVSAINPRKNIDKSFVYQFLLWFEPKWINIEQGSTFTAISGDDIQSVEIGLPNLSEQKKIAEFLTLIGGIIESEKRKLGSMAQFKESLLQQML